MFECKLVSEETQTAFGHLCLLGHYLVRERVLEPLSGVEIAQKSVKPSSGEAHRRPRWHPIGLPGPLRDQRPGAPRCAAAEGLRQGSMR
jgi:hypothetical protein